MAKMNKQALMTGLGDGYFDFMKTEETETTGPVYEGQTKHVPSLESAETEVTYEATPVFLSNKKHSELGRMTGATITLSAAYLPEGFAEEATGAVKIGPGAYVYTASPQTKFFRFAFPMSDENGKEVLVNFPKCTLEPVGLNPSTEGESKDASISTFNIVANQLFLRGETVVDGVYSKVDLRVAGANYDRDALLDEGWYDEATLAKHLKSGSGDPQV